jgi:hypothetical protein
MLNMSATLDTGYSNVSCPKPFLRIAILALFKNPRCDMVATHQLDLPAYWFLLINPMFTPERRNAHFFINEQIGGASTTSNPISGE